MTVKEIKRTLSNMYNDDDEIIIAWWDKKMAPVNTKRMNWEDQVETVENKMDWSWTHDCMSDIIQDNILREIKQEEYDNEYILEEDEEFPRQPNK